MHVYIYIYIYVMCICVYIHIHIYHHGLRVGREAPGVGDRQPQGAVDDGDAPLYSIHKYVDICIYIYIYIILYIYTHTYVHTCIHA